MSGTLLLAKILQSVVRDSSHSHGFKYQPVGEIDRILGAEPLRLHQKAVEDALVSAFDLECHPAMLADGGVEIEARAAGLPLQP